MVNGVEKKAEFNVVSQAKLERATSQHYRSQESLESMPDQPDQGNNLGLLTCNLLFLDAFNSVNPILYMNFGLNIFNLN